MRHKARMIASLIVTLGTAAGVAGATAQSYPSRVVQIIVPATAGSSADILGRVLADGFSSRLGKPFIIVDKPGANGVLGTADVARANPDGYMLVHGATYSITVQPLIDKQARLYAEFLHADLPDFQERSGPGGAAEFAVEDGARHHRGG